MKLNPDCVRDLMLKLEDISEIRHNNNAYWFAGITLESLMACASIAEKYTSGEVAYTLLQLSESRYIVMECSVDKETKIFHVGNILYLTPKGHDFIAGIQNKETWTLKLKPALKAFGNVSLSVIEAVSKGATDAVISKFSESLYLDKP